MVALVDEWRQALRRDRNHPAVIGWCPLNETGTGPEVALVETLLAVTHSIDPTRPLLDSSGYTHFLPETDVFDAHDYAQNPAELRGRYALFAATGMEPWHNQPVDARSRYRGQPFFISEYGGIRLKTKREMGKGWGYGGESLPPAEFLARYKALTDAQLDNPNLCGFCYTQLTDIEQEQNGVYFYDRSPKYDPALLRAINARVAAYETQPPRVRRVRWQTLVPTSEKTGQQWRYTTTRPPDCWQNPNFNDACWPAGKGGFGTAGTPGAVVGTVWNTGDVWLRRHFCAAHVPAALATLRIHHDNEAEVFLNGRKVAEFTDYLTGYSQVLAEPILAALAPGDNVLAVHCHQITGGQFIDVGIELGFELAPPGR
jgi:hypothetical protein